MTNPAALLASRFVLRDDVYPLHYKDGAYRPVHAPLNKGVLEKHLRGGHCVGVYQLRGSVCKWLCLDVDGANGSADGARDAVSVIVRTCEHFGLSPIVERSGGKGWHVWVFCEETEAAIVQAIGKGILREAGDGAYIGTQDVEIFPKQASVGSDGFGNLVKLPWGKRADNGKRGEFVDAATLEALGQETQARLLEEAVVYPSEALIELINENGWQVSEPSPPPASNDSATWRRDGYYPPLPCFEYVIDPDSVALIPNGYREKALFAFASQRKRSGCSPKQALRDILTLHRERCALPNDIPERKVRATVESVYRSVNSTIGCDILQPAGLCPVLLHGEVCPVFQKAQEKVEERQGMLAHDETALSITPLRVSRGKPPIYTATVRGQDLRLSLQHLVKFHLFKERCVAELDFVPELPFIPTKDDPKKSVSPGRIWDLIVGEALASVIEEDAPPEDASAEGVTWDAIREFVMSRPVAEDRSKLLMGKVIVEGDYYYFRGSDLRKWLKINGIELLSPHETWILVRDHGGISGGLKIKGKNNRCWKMPVTSMTELEALSGAECGNDDENFPKDYDEGFSKHPPLGLVS